MRCLEIVIKLIIFILKKIYLLVFKMLEVCEAFVSYESGIILDRQGFDVNDEPVWILGREYNTTTSRLTK